MDYICLKCGAEFKIDAMDRVVCPECRAQNSVRARLAFTTKSAEDLGGARA